MVSKQPRKNRKRSYRAPLHVKRRAVRAHLSKELRKKHGRRSVLLRKGDRVKVLAGGFKGFSGAVTRVDVNNGVAFVENAVVRRQAGREMPKAFVPSVFVVTELAEKHELGGLKKAKAAANAGPAKAGKN